MFKKADKNELRTWCLGSLMMFVLCAVVSVALIVDIFTNEFKVGTLVFAILAALVAFLFCKYMINSYKAYKTYDERKEVEDQEQKELEEKAARELEEKIQREKEEMEAIRIAEEERAKNNALELEKTKKENLMKEANENEKKH